MDGTKIASGFQMIGSTLKSLNVRNDFIGIEEGIELKRKLDITHQIVGIYERQNEELMGVVALNLKSIISQEKMKFSITLCIEGAFVFNSLEKEEFEKMLEINGIAALYSIARALIMSISAQSLASGSIILPMINVYQYSKNINEDNKNKSK